MSQLSKIFTLQATDIDGICASQTIAVGSLLINGALSAGMTSAQILTATVTGDQTGATLAITGLDADGNTISETITLSNASTTNTTKYFKSVSSAVVAGTVTAASTITLGHTSTNGGISGTIATNYNRGTVYNCGIGVVLSGTGTYSVQHTFDDIQILPSEATPTYFTHDVMRNQTVSEDGNYAFPVRGIRLLVTAANAAITITVVE